MPARVQVQWDEESSLTRIALAQFGRALATREKARQVKSLLRKSQSTTDAQLVLDFNGVSALSPSFADELVNTLAEAGSELWVIGLSDEVFSLLNSVAARRSTLVHRLPEASPEQPPSIPSPKPVGPSPDS